MNTVQAPRSRGIERADQLQVWANREVIPSLLDFARALNRRFSISARITTAGTGAFTPIWTSPDLHDQRTWLIEATVIGRGGATARSAFVRRAFFSRETTLAQEGATSAVYTQNAGGFGIQFSVVSNHVTLDVQDAGGLTVQWLAFVEVLEHPLP